MSPDSTPFSIQTISHALLKNRIISQAQAKSLIENKDILKIRLEKKPYLSTGEKPVDPMAMVDAIVALKLKRSDGIADSLDEETIFQILAKEWNIPYKKIDPLKLDLNLVTTTIPRSFALRHLVLAVSVSDGVLTVATPNPFNIEAIEDISRVSPFKEVKAVVSSKSDIVKLINEFYGFKRSIAEAETQFAGPSVDLGNLEQFVRIKSPDELPSTDHHIINAVNYLLKYAFDQRASDIHLEPKRDFSLVRMRIDGVLHTVHNLPKSVYPAIVSRIKTLSRLDMAEKRRPQDGRIKTNKGETEVEIRVSTIPVAFGEKVVMRIMDPDILFQDVENLGFTSADFIRYNKFVRMPHGIVLVTGPTGSGKSTTLYSTLRSLSTPEINITTVEDPIEMINEDFNQIAVQPVIGVTFGSILRHILRQDPDIIMIGEMRDLETAENAIQAALTGHLVLSTLHTNDAPTSITRLLDLGIPSFLIQSTLIGIIAQRLVRKICVHCMKSFEMDSTELKAMGIDTGKSGVVRLHRGEGCQRCRGTGYHGRTGVFEVLPVTDEIKQLITSQTDLSALRIAARKEGMITLRENAVKKLLKGETTYQEVLRVTWEQV